MGTIFIANKPFDIEANVVNWHENGWDATSQYCRPTAVEANPPCIKSASGFDIPYGLKAASYTPRFSLRPALRSFGMNPPLDAVKSVIKQFVLHHDGCTSAEMCWNVLQNERGLSCHFIIDNDGTIFQTIDLALCAWHAAEFNPNSIGVEFCNRGDANQFRDVYTSGRFGPVRDTKPCKINNHTILAYDYTREQKESFRLLAKALTRLLPNLPIEYPQSSPGQQAWGTLDNVFGFNGYLGHYHITAQKWDPGPWDFKEFCRQLRGANCFPMWTRPDPKRRADEKPEIPKRQDELMEGAKQLYLANEARAEGGFFPVGPWGEQRLWHGGVHLAGSEGAPVFAPFPGRLVAARFGPPTSIGSANFVLLRHDMTLGKSPAQFYTLMMHLQDSSTAAAADQPPWMANVDWKKVGVKGAVVLLDEPIEASQVIGRIGKAGPSDLSKAQVHMEIFAKTPIFTDLSNSPWSLIDGTAGGRFCDVDTVQALIDSNKDGTFDRQELATYFSSGDQSFYFKVTLHVSEWTENPSWTDALRLPKEFRSFSNEQIAQLVAEQITPGLWWNDAVAKHAKLPPDGTVYHYHPITFIRWFNEKLIEASATDNHIVNRDDAKEVPADITDDRVGGNMASEKEIVGDPCDTSLGLEEMVLGFDAPGCAP